MNNSPTYLRLLRRNGSAKQSSFLRLLPTSLKLPAVALGSYGETGRRTGLRDRLTNFLCLALLLLGATALGMDNSDEELIEAVRRGNLGEVESLIEQGVSVEAKNWNGWTPLMLVSEAGHEDMCRLLIANKAAVEAKSDAGSTPLICAARSGYKGMCELLIENKASVNAKDSYGWTPLIFAAANGKEDMCRLLIANKANLDAQINAAGLSSLILAAANGHEGVCKLLISAQLEQARKDNPALITLLGIAKNKKSGFSCYVPYDVAKMIAHQVFEQAIYREKQRMIGQLNRLDDFIKPKWSVYINQQMNLANQ